MTGVGLTVVIVKDISPAFGGRNIISLMYSIWEQFMFLSCTALLIGIFKRYFNKTNPSQKCISDITYLMYLVHSAVIAFVVTVLTFCNFTRVVYVFLVMILSLGVTVVTAKGLKKIVNL